MGLYVHPRRAIASHCKTHSSPTKRRNDAAASGVGRGTVATRMPSGTTPRTTRHSLAHRTQFAGVSQIGPETTPRRSNPMWSPDGMLIADFARSVSDGIERSGLRRGNRYFVARLFANSWAERRDK